MDPTQQTHIATSKNIEQHAIVTLLILHFLLFWFFTYCFNKCVLCMVKSTCMRLTFTYFILFPRFHHWLPILTGCQVTVPPVFINVPWCSMIFSHIRLRFPCRSTSDLRFPGERDSALRVPRRHRAPLRGDLWWRCNMTWSLKPLVFSQCAIENCNGNSWFTDWKWTIIVCYNML